MFVVVHKQMYLIQSNCWRSQGLNGNFNIRNIAFIILYLNDCQFIAFEGYGLVVVRMQHWYHAWLTPLTCLISSFIEIDRYNTSQNTYVHLLSSNECLLAWWSVSIGIVAIVMTKMYIYHYLMVAYLLAHQFQ